MTSTVYLIDTDVLSESRKGVKADRGVIAFFEAAVDAAEECYVSAITIGELRRGERIIRRRGDAEQAKRLDDWLRGVVDEYGDRVLPVDRDVAEVWGHLRAPAHENAIDKLIAATALVNGLAVVTRNIRHFTPTGVKLLNPFG